MGAQRDVPASRRYDAIRREMNRPTEELARAVLPTQYRMGADVHEIQRRCWSEGDPTPAKHILMSMELLVVRSKDWDPATWNRAQWVYKQLIAQHDQAVLDAVVTAPELVWPV